MGRDNHLHEDWIGDQNTKTVEHTRAEVTKLVAAIRKKGKRVLILADITRLGKASLSSRIAGYKLMYDLDYDKAAIFGSYRLKGLIDAVVQASGCGFKVRFFNNREQALEWLKS